MNITQILQIADWAITGTGPSTLTSGPIAGQIKFVQLASAIVHFNKNTDEVIAIVISEIDGQLIYVIDNNKLEQLIGTDSTLKYNSVTKEKIIIRLNELYNREPDSVLQIDKMEASTLAVIDDLADQAGLTRNGFMVKIIVDQCERVVAAE